MPSNSFIYSLKVWLTSVGLGPAMFIIFNICTHNRNHLNSTGFINMQVEIYEMSLMYGGLFSLPTWLLFYLIIKIIAVYYPAMPAGKSGVAIIGALLTLGTFALVFPILGFGPAFYYLAISYGMCTAGGSLFYELEAIDCPEER
jgi:hypothetical protein